MIGTGCHRRSRHTRRLPVSPLPRELPVVTTPATTVVAGGVPTGARLLDLSALARILYLSAGVVRVTEVAKWGMRPPFFRATGSAGGRIPAGGVPRRPGRADVADGVYWYHPLEHALVRIGPPAGGEATTLVVGASRVPAAAGDRSERRASAFGPRG
jgi:hypothetical protein